VGDTDAARQKMTKDTVRKQWDSAVEEAASWKAGVMVTEWGYDPKGIRAAEYLTWQSELAEEHLASSFFWVWKEQEQGQWGCFDYDAATGAWSSRPEMKKLLARVRPAAVAGWPQHYAFDRASGVFELVFTDDPTVDAPHVLSIAPVLGAPLEVTCDGDPVPGALPDARGDLSLVCGHGDGKAHTLRITVAPLP
jgi:hypothetical protein